MINEENITHIVRGKPSISSLSLKFQNIYCLLIHYLPRETKATQELAFIVK